MSLIFVFIALMGISSASACDVCNCTEDDMNYIVVEDDYYDICHYHENNLENIGAVGNISIDDVGLENVSAADDNQQNDLENSSTAIMGIINPIPGPDFENRHINDTQYEITILSVISPEVPDTYQAICIGDSTYDNITDGGINIDSNGLDNTEGFFKR